MKRLLSIVFCSCVLFGSANAQQTPTKQDQPADVKVTSANWKDGRNPWWGRCYECSGGIPEVASRHFSKDLEKHRLKAQAKRPKYIATAVVKNKSTQPIKSVSVDFIFMEIPTRRELVRYLMRSDMAIRPGQKKKIRQKIFDNDKDLANFHPLYGDWLVSTGEQRRVRVIISRVEYAGGSVWEMP